MAQAFSLSLSLMIAHTLDNCVVGCGEEGTC